MARLRGDRTVARIAQDAAESVVAEGFAAAAAFSGFDSGPAADFVAGPAPGSPPPDPLPLASDVAGVASVTAAELLLLLSVT